MGCTTSKLDHEDTVRRCKERRRLMKEVVYARHNLAAAHSDYCRSLRLTGDALSTFGAGEPLSVYDHAPPVLLRTPSSSSTATISMKPPPPASNPPPIPSASSSPPPPPPVAASNLQHRRRKPIKVPHILSDSSFTASPKYAKANSTYSTTASQASSAWNWENFNPPSPPTSEYFEQQKNKNNTFPVENEEEDESKSNHNQNQQTHDFDFFLDDDNVSNYSAYSNRSIRNDKNNQVKQGVYKKINERWDNGNMEEETEREEVQCSEWGDRDHRYSTSSSSSSSLDDDDEASRSGVGSRSNFESNMNGFVAGSKKSTASWEKEIVVQHKDLAEIVNAIKEYFDKAASAGDQVSEILEIGRAQLDKSFIKLKRTVYHSSGVFSNLSSSWTSKPPLVVKYKLEPGSVSGGAKSLCSTLERLLAWEKKLYQEVKAKERVKMKHEKKLARLQNQEYKGEEEEKLDETKTSIKKLQSLIFVTSQAVSATSSAIIGQRDSELVPHLVELCHGFMCMWRSMNQFHQVQNDIVQQVRSLVNESTKGESTSDTQRQATRDLESAVSAWHSSFCCLIKFLRDFIQSLHSWFQLSLISVNIEETNSPHESLEAFAFSDEWKLALDRVPDAVASEAIKSFINVVHSISLKQIEELKIKKRTESASKYLEKKTSSLRNIEKKYYNSYSVVGIGLPDTGPDNGHVLDARDPLAEKKLKLTAYQRRVEDEMLKHSKAVEVTRAMTLNNIQTGLPGVFQAMTSFSALFTEALEAVCKRSYAIK